MKKTIMIIAALLLCALCFSACSPFGGKLIGKDAALEIALEDAGVDKKKAVDIDVELETEKFNKWYEVEFDAGSVEYDYRIQAETGEILFNKTR